MVTCSLSSLFSWNRSVQDLVQTWFYNFHLCFSLFLSFPVRCPYFYLFFLLWLWFLLPHETVIAATSRSYSLILVPGFCVSASLHWCFFPPDNETHFPIWIILYHILELVDIRMYLLTFLYFYQRSLMVFLWVSNASRLQKLCPCFQKLIKYHFRLSCPSGNVYIFPCRYIEKLYV